MVDKTLLVYVDREIQLQRLMTRNHLSKEEAEARIRSQMPLAEKVKLADAVINNNGSVEDTKKQLIGFISWLGINEITSSRRRPLFIFLLMKIITKLLN